MNKMVFMPKKIQKVLLFYSIFASGAFNPSLLQARAEAIWDNADNPKDLATPLVWKTPVESRKSKAPAITWEKIPETKKNSH